jgi:threonine dehydratase
LRDPCIAGSKHGRLAAAVGMPRQNHRHVRCQRAQRIRHLPDTIPVPLLRAARRAAWAQLAKWKVVPEHKISGIGKRVRYGNEQRRFAIAPGPVGESHGRCWRTAWPVKIATNSGLFESRCSHVCYVERSLFTMISLSDIVAARERIRSGIRQTPAPYSEDLSRESRNELYLKLENLQVTGSFKERGALNRLLTLTAEERARGIIAASAGNHAQGVAYHGSRLGIRSVICMPEFTPFVKISAVRGYGAEVILHGGVFEEALAEAQRRCARERLVFVHPFNDEAVIAGQGTIGLELLEQIPRLEAVVAPVGGGGLIGGIACAVKEARPEVRVIGVQSSALPSMRAALTAGKPVTVDPSPTIADGIAVRIAGDKTFELVRKYVDEVVTVDDEEIARAILRLLERQKTLAEGAGAAGVAALLHKEISLRGKKTAVVISGGNIDVMLLSHIIERGLVKDGRLVRFRVTLPDHPGSLERLTQVIGRSRANIVQVLHDRTYFGVHLGETTVDVTMETRGQEHVQELAGALHASGYRFERIL